MNTPLLHSNKQNRTLAADTFFVTLKELLQNDSHISEMNLCDAWKNNLRIYKNMFPDGWYIPPPHGFAVLFSDEQHLERINFKSLRPEMYWPKQDSFFQKDGFILFFASPVDKTHGVIGDFGALLYLGKNVKIQDHYKKSFALVHELYEKIAVGMSFAEIYSLVEILMKKQNLYSDLFSPTDPTGTNIGHSIVSLTPEELDDIKIGAMDWSTAKDRISKRRIFINKSEKTILQPGMAITLEPRPKSTVDPSLPQAWFHTVCVIDENGKKELLTGFEEIFEFLKAGYLLK